jgi:hypothetical protein
VKSHPSLPAQRCDRLSVEACKQEHRGQLYTSLKEIFLHYRHIATWRSACSPTVQHVFFCLLSFWSVFQVFDTIFDTIPESAAI